MATTPYETLPASYATRSNAAANQSASRPAAVYIFRVIVLRLALPAIVVSVWGLPGATNAQDANPRAAFPDGVPRPVASEIDAMALLVRGMTQHRLGNSERALEALRNALLISPGEPAIASVLASVYEDIADLPTAEYYARLALDNGSSAAYAIQLARILDSQGRQAEARTLLLGVRASKDSLAVDAALGSIGKTNNAALEAGIGNAGSDASLVRRYLARDSVAQAIPLARRLVDEDPRIEAHWQDYITALLRSGDAERAAEIAREATSLFPGSVDLHIAWARAVGLGGSDAENDRAAVLDRLVALASYVDALDHARLIAYASLITTDVQQADSLAMVAVDLDAKNVVARSVLASIRARSGRRDEAEEHLRHTTATDPYEWDVAVVLGTALHTLGYTDRARAAVEAALQCPYPAIRESARSLIGR